ncbi:MAG: hypothetical protein WCJ02_02845 [bacterium]
MLKEADFVMANGALSEVEEPPLKEIAVAKNRLFHFGRLLLCKGMLFFVLFFSSHKVCDWHTKRLINTRRSQDEKRSDVGCVNGVLSGSAYDGMYIVWS